MNVTTRLRLWLAGLLIPRGWFVAVSPFGGCRVRQDIDSATWKSLMQAETKQVWRELAVAQTRQNLRDVGAI